jgi:hypothetical protein
MKLRIESGVIVLGCLLFYVAAIAISGLPDSLLMTTLARPGSTGRMREGLV